MIIAIDGHSSTGKSTLAKSIANQLGYIYIDSGAIFRALTLYALDHQIIDDQKNINTQKLTESLPQITINFKYNAKTKKSNIQLNGVCVEDQIRQPIVADNVSHIATIESVRDYIVNIQRQIAESNTHTSIVIDGRDIGTVVFPKAEIKIFMTASATVRAKRRYDELLKKNISTTFEEVLENIQKRDEMDTQRAIAPLRKAEDAILIDNSDLSPEQQLKMLIDIVNKKIAQRNGQ